MSMTTKMPSGEVVPTGASHYRLHANGKARTYFKQANGVWFEWKFNEEVNMPYFTAIKTPDDAHMFRTVK